MHTARKAATRFLVLLSLAVAALLSAAFPFEQGPDPVIFPLQRIPLVFDHEYHVRTPDEAQGLDGEGLACDFCHENIADSEQSSDRDIPGHSVCEGCHSDWIGDEDEPAPLVECVRCHSDLNPSGSSVQTSTRAEPMVIPPPNVKFSHKAHLEAEAKCVDCHPNVPNKALATRDDFPTMDRCFDCHAKKEASTECSACHMTDRSGRVLTSYATGKLEPRRFHLTAIHDADFLRDHASPAQREPDYCASCHGQDFCLSCHDGFGRDTRYHPADWIATHYLRAKKDDFRCESCHRFQDFCLNCHIRTGIATVGSVADPKQRRTIRLADNQPIGPHPMRQDGWLDPGSFNFHGFQAQRSIRACASCHQEQFCINCHGSSFNGNVSAGGNPHGPNPQRLRGSAASKHNARVCLKCHHPADPNWR